MDIKRVGSQPSAKGPAEWFTGMVRIDPLFQAPEPAFVQGASVTFEPGARTAWHTHPLGQTLIVTAGSGRAQRRGTDRGDSPRRRHLVLAWRETLARGRSDNSHDAHCHSGKERRQGGRLDGARHRRTIPEVSFRPSLETRGCHAETKRCLKDNLSQGSELNITATGGRSGRKITLPVCATSSHA
jgi:hypothetical protein